MANEERGQQQVFQDVNPSQLGQLSPGNTPHNPELQNQNRSRGRGLSRGGENRQLGKATGQPPFTEMGSEKLLEAGQEAARNLGQYDFTTSQKELQQKNENYTADRLGTVLKTGKNNENTLNVHESDKDLVQDKKQEKEQDKDHDHER